MVERLTKHDDHPCVHCDGMDWCRVDCDNKKIYDRLQHYEDLEAQGRLITLPAGMNLRKLLDVLTEYASDCPSDYNLSNRCELSCFECWLAALKGADNDTNTND